MMEQWWFTRGDTRRRPHIFRSQFGGLSLCGRAAARTADNLTRKVPDGEICRLCQERLVALTHID